MHSIKIGLLTIGQSPREDILSEIRPLFSHHTEILEAGLLDHFSLEEMERFKPEAREIPLVSRLRDGSQVQLSEKKVKSLLPGVIKSIQTKMNLNAVGILCTHDFPKTKCSFPVIFPFDYLSFLVNEILHTRNLGVVVPLENQTEMARKKWQTEKVVVEAKSPYLEGHGWEEVTKRFTRKKIDAVVLDCIGYTTRDKQEIENLISAPVLLPRIILVSAINQLF